MTFASLWRQYLGEGEPRIEPPADLAHRLSRVQLQASRRLAASWAGAYRSAFKGEGIEFAGVREYTPGDDVRTIDWRVTARTGRLAVRRYAEERNRTVLFLVDVGPGLVAGSGDRSLLDVAAEIVALVGSAAVAGGDRVTLAAWSDRQELLVTPRRDRAALLRLVRSLLALRPTGRTSDLARAFASVPRTMRRAGVLIVISPFLASGYGSRLKALARRHELLVVRLWDGRAGTGTSNTLIPARDPAGTAGWSATSEPDPPDELAAVRPDVVTAGPDTFLAPVLTRAFLSRSRRRGV